MLISMILRDRFLLAKVFAFSSLNFDTTNCMYKIYFPMVGLVFETIYSLFN
jgi:hypothetical protein